MSELTTSASGPSPESFTDLMSSVYTQVGGSALLGSFVAGTKTTRSTLLNKMRFEPLPEDLVTAALEVSDDEVLWALSQRSDLSKKAIERLLSCNSPLVHRRLASSIQMTNEDLVRLLPGDEYVRQRVFVHPNASRELRRSILSARNSSGAPLPRASALDQELMKPEYALWLLDSDMQQGRLQALTQLPELPASHQWHVAWRIAEGAVPLSTAISSRGWVAPLHSALREALSALPTGGEELALGVLASNLRNLGAPPLFAEDEARLLADESEASALSEPNELDWSGLERVLRSGDMTVAAVRFLLQRKDRTPGFTAAALAFHGDAPGVLPLCDLHDLQKASTMSGFAVAERSRLVKLMVSTPQLPYKLLDMVRSIPIRDVLTALRSAEEELSAYQLRRLSGELKDALGDSPEAWHAFESARLNRRSITFADALKEATEA